MYYYKRTEFSPHCLYTVGHDENGKWIPESDHEDIHSASRRVNFLNGGVEETIESDELATLRAENARLREALETALAEGMKTRAGRDVVRNALDFELPDRL